METKWCGGGNCECDLNAAHDKKREILKIHDFLAGLDDSVHGIIRSKLCSITPLPDLDSVYQTIVQNETIRQSVTSEVPVMSFAIQVPPANGPHSSATGWPKDSSGQMSDGYRGGSRDYTRSCTTCGKKGHDETSCFKVIGYP